MISPNMEKHKQSNQQESNSLNTAREFIKIAKSYAYFKKTEGYREDDYTLFEIINQDACLDICSRGPADYYYEKAYEILCEELGPNHWDTLQLMDEIVNYHSVAISHIIEKYDDWRVWPQPSYFSDVTTKSPHSEGRHASIR